MPQPTAFRTHGPSGVQHCAANRAWSEYSQTLQLNGYTREQREAMRNAFYAGWIAGWAHVNHTR